MIIPCVGLVAFLAMLISLAPTLCPCACCPFVALPQPFVASVVACPPLSIVLSFSTDPQSRPSFDASYPEAPARACPHGGLPPVVVCRPPLCKYMLEGVHPCAPARWFTAHQPVLRSRPKAGGRPTHVPPPIRYDGLLPCHMAQAMTVRPAHYS